MMVRKPEVMILGAGPAGLLAAHAADRAGYKFTVYSRPDKHDGKRPEKSRLYGCQYLHKLPPGISPDVRQQRVRYLLDGSPAAYRRKVYGDAWDGKVSPDEYGPEEDHTAYDLRYVYDVLWNRYSSAIVPTVVGPDMADVLFKTTKTIIFSSIPAPDLCRRPEHHKFLTQDVYASGSSPTSTPPITVPDGTVVCNGSPHTAWYRAATVFGHTTVEWPGGRRPPFDGVVPVRKPLATDCNCRDGASRRSNRWHRIGRYGTWTKSVLVHTAYAKAVTVLR